MHMQATGICIASGGKGAGKGAGEDDGCPRSDSWTIYLVHEYYNGRITFVCLSVGIIGMQ